jgi:hypothetical protein
MTRYNPATNSPDWGGNTTRGWRRWERAARHALRHPMTDAAQVYRARIDLALTVATAHRAVGDTKDGPWQFMGPRVYMRDGQWETVRSRMYSTCSTYCTVLQITLDFNARSLDGVARAFAVKPDANRPHLRTVEKLDKTTLRKGGVSCYVCTRKIRKK